MIYVDTFNDTWKTYLGKWFEENMLQLVLTTKLKSNSEKINWTIKWTFNLIMRLRTIYLSCSW